jgi:hypothetical protein
VTAANGSAEADGSRLLAMEDPEAWLRAITAPLALVREGSPYPVARLSLEAVANAFVVLGLLPAARAEEILAAQQPVLEAAGFRVGREIGELSVNPGTRSFQEARAAALDSPRQIPLAVAAGRVRCRLRRHDLAITWATLTPERIRLRYHGGARDGDRDLARALAGEITEDIAELSITDDHGGTYRVPAANLPSGISGHCLASGETRWIPEGEFLAVPVRGEAASPGESGSRGGRTAGSRLVDRLLRDRHGGTRHRGHHGRCRRRAGRRRRAAAGKRGTHRDHGPGMPGLALGAE